MYQVVPKKDGGMESTRRYKADEDRGPDKNSEKYAGVHEKESRGDKCQSTKKEESKGGDGVEGVDQLSVADDQTESKTIFPDDQRGWFD